MKVTICIGSSCHLKGSRSVIDGLQKLIEKDGLKDKIELSGAFCMKNCVNGVSVKIGDEIFSVSPEMVEDFYENNIKSNI